jgi:hypothetical protein
VLYFSYVSGRYCTVCKALTARPCALQLAMIDLISHQLYITGCYCPGVGVQYSEKRMSHEDRTLYPERPTSAKCLTSPSRVEMASFRLGPCVELNVELDMGVRVLDRRCFFISRSRTGMQRLRRPTHLRRNANANEGGAIYLYSR